MAKSLRECLVPIDSMWHRGNLTKEQFDREIDKVREELWANYLENHGRSADTDEDRRQQVADAARRGAGDEPGGPPSSAFNDQRRKAVEGVREGSPRSRERSGEKVPDESPPDANPKV